MDKRNGRRSEVFLELEYFFLSLYNLSTSIQFMSHNTTNKLESISYNYLGTQPNESSASTPRISRPLYRFLPRKMQKCKQVSSRVLFSGIGEIPASYELRPP